MRGSCEAFLAHKCPSPVADCRDKAAVKTTVGKLRFVAVPLRYIRPLASKISTAYCPLHSMCPAPSPKLQSNNCLREFSSRENLRCSVRYSLRAEVVVHWIGPNGIAQQLRGCTRDVSTGGAYIFAPELPPAGHAVQISIHLPMFGGESRVPCVNVKGHVLRVDKPPRATECGFAVRNEKVTVCTA